MSIRRELGERIKEERLLKLGFLIPGRPERRTILMASEISDLVLGPWDDSKMGERCARLRANLESFLAGDLINVCWEPFRASKRHQIGRLRPVEEGVWDVRSIDSPGLRVFFCLAEKDVMVALTCSPRSIEVPWLNRPPLGPKESKEWKHAISECKRQWRSLFPAHLPLVGVHADECLSNTFSG